MSDRVQSLVVSVVCSVGFEIQVSSFGQGGGLPGISRLAVFGKLRESKAKLGTFDGLRLRVSSLGRLVVSLAGQCEGSEGPRAYLRSAPPGFDWAPIPLRTNFAKVRRQPSQEHA